MKTRRPARFAQQGERVLKIGRQLQVGVLDHLADGFGGEGARLPRCGDNHLGGEREENAAISSTDLSRIAP